ncbi:MAG: hypothetical protein ACLGXA_07440 [Acidobacteriota bacterium]
MENPKLTLAVRHYIQRFLTAMGLYVIFLVGAVWAFPRYHPTGLLAYLIAILPALPIIGVIGVVALYMTEEPDEFQRVILIRAMLWGIGLTLAATTAWGFLEAFSLAPHLDLYLVFPLFCVLAAISNGMVRLRYR